MVSSRTNNNNESGKRQDRVPPLLQSVFLNSNRGKEVNKPPPQAMAQRTYTSNWAFRRNDMDTKNMKKVYRQDKDKVLSKNRTEALPTPMDTPSAAVSPKTEEVKDTSTLQEYFDALLHERGYENVQLFNTLDTAYYNKASALQVASYGPRMIQIVKTSDAPALRETLANGGLSPNLCNQFGESLLHMVCRRGNLELLQIFIDAGAVLQVSDDYGRTPLHDACWAATPAFPVVHQLAKRDPYLFFLKDRRGSLPLSYVHKADWPQWKQWLDDNMDMYFAAEQAASFAPTDLCTTPPNSIPASGKTDLSMELVTMVANGNLSPREARIMAETARREAEEEEATVADTVLMGSDEDSFYDSDSDYDSDFDDDDEDSDFGDILENDDLAEMLQIAQVANTRVVFGN